MADERESALLDTIDSNLDLAELIEERKVEIEQIQGEINELGDENGALSRVRKNIFKLFSKYF